MPRQPYVPRYLRAGSWQAALGYLRRVLRRCAGLAGIWDGPDLETLRKSRSQAYQKGAARCQTGPSVCPDAQISQGGAGKERNRPCSLDFVVIEEIVGYGHPPSSRSNRAIQSQTSSQVPESLLAQQPLSKEQNHRNSQPAQTAEPRVALREQEDSCEKKYQCDHLGPPFRRNQ